ncbi:MAG: DUF2878 domain-containing protein [Acidobacteriota bacterium]
MRRQRLGTLFDGALVQLGWWICVPAAGKGYPLIGVAAISVLLVVQTWGLPEDARRRAWRHILAMGAIGTVIDSLHAVLGFLTFRDAFAPWLAPVWITAMWCHFTTVVPAFAALRSRLWVAVVFGAIGGPLAYFGGERLGAAEFHPEAWMSWAAIGVTWAIAFPIMVRWMGALPPPEATPKG